MNWKPVVLIPAFFTTLGMLQGCRIEAHDNDKGKENVKIDTPFGGIHVDTNKTEAADVGLPGFPGATRYQGDDKNKQSADVHLGFGKWQLRVKVVEYVTPSSQEDLTSFYKKALGRYGDVITCRNDEPVGTPSVTREGLGCKDSHGKNHMNVNLDDKDSKNLILKAGSPSHQHIVSIQNPKDHQTRFSLIALDLPKDLDKDEGETN